MVRAKKQQAMNQTLKAGVVVGAVDSINLSAIFLLFLREMLHKFLEETGKYFMFPIAAAASIIGAVLAWRQAYIKDGKSRYVVRALVETGAALAVTTVVIGSLVASSIFGGVAPIVFAIVLGAKSLFHAASAIYYGVLSSTAESEKKKAKYAALAKANTIATVAGIFATVAVVGVMLLGKVALAVFGITAGVIGTMYAVNQGIKLANAEKEEKQEDKSMTDLLEDKPFIRPEVTKRHTKSVVPLFNTNVTNQSSYKESKGSTLFGNSKPVMITSNVNKQRDYFKYKSL